MKLYKVTVPDLRRVTNVLNQLILFNLKLNEVYSGSDGNYHIMYEANFSAYDGSEEYILDPAGFS